MAGFYFPELKGALTISKEQWPWAKYHETDRVKKRFLEDFTTAYNAMTFKPDPESVAAVAASVAEEEKPPEPESQK